MHDESKYSLYILRFRDNRLYVGISSDPEKRLICHRQSRDAKFTKYCRNPELIHTEKFSDLNTAMRREKQIEGWTRAKKEALIVGNKKLLKNL